MVSKWVITYLYMEYIAVLSILLTIYTNFLGHPQLMMQRDVAPLSTTSIGQS